MNKIGDLPLTAQTVARHFIGGVKKSGHGREKGRAGLLSFTTLKTVAIKHG